MLFTFCILLTGIATTLGLQRLIDRNHKKIRYDFPQLIDVRDLLPQPIKYLKGMTDIIPFGLLGILFYTLSWADILHFFNIYGFLLILRPLCFSVTIMPPPSNSIPKTSILGGSCDCIFSGHTAITLLELLFLKKYYPYLPQYLIFEVLYCLAILISRAHYTVDIILAWIITIQSYITYFHYVLPSFAS
jgi:hypothetical protein